MLLHSSTGCVAGIASITSYARHRAWNMRSRVRARRLCADEDGRHAGLVPGAGAHRRAGGRHRRLCRALPRAGRVPGRGRRAHARLPRAGCAAPCKHATSFRQRETYRGGRTRLTLAMSGGCLAQARSCTPGASDHLMACRTCYKMWLKTMRFISKQSSGTPLYVLAQAFHAVHIHLQARIKAGELCAQAARQQHAPPGWRARTGPCRGARGPCGWASARARTRLSRRRACGRPHAPRMLVRTGCAAMARKLALCRCRRSSRCNPALLSCARAPPARWPWRQAVSC